MNSVRCWLCVGLLAALARGQELLWEVHPVSGIKYEGVYPEFGDYDGDGSMDLLVGAGDYTLSLALPLYRVLSGVDGTVLADLYPPYDVGYARGAGDFDGDGHPDVSFFLGSSVTGVYFEVWSIAGHQRLLQIPNVVGGAFGGAQACNLDVDGDGRNDVVFVQGDAAIRAYDHFGSPLYEIPTLSLGFLPVDLVAIGDLDGDHCDDYVVGAAEYVTGQALGSVILVSGRTGTPVRLHFGPQPYSFINSDVRVAGDIDGDGVLDYAAGNKNAPSGVIMVWSGATGDLIRQWVVPVAQLSGLLLAGMDIDLDGRPDVLSVVSAYLNPSGLYGRVRTLSSRDGQDLITLEPQQYASFWGQTYANLGVQPGNPYPVFAIVDNPVIPPYVLWPRIRIWRCSPPGTSFTGQGCSGSGDVPTIGIRRIDGAPTDHSRIVLGTAPANAFAVLVASPTSLSLPAPVPLGFLGLPGCDLLVAPLIVRLTVTGSTGMDRGYAAYDLAAPMVVAGGTAYAAQWVVLDPVTLAHATTQRLEFLLQ